MDVLLKQDEIDALPITIQRPREAEAICRAQVRKVVDEWGKRQGVCVSGSTPCEFAGVSAERCFICQFQDFIEALKAAGGEG